MSNRPTKHKNMPPEDEPSFFLENFPKRITIREIMPAMLNRNDNRQTMSYESFSPSKGVPYKT